MRLGRVAAVGLWSCRALSGHLSLLWPMKGQPLLTHFSAQCVSFPAFLSEVLDPGLPVLRCVDFSVGVRCDLVFSLIPLHILIFAHVLLSKVIFSSSLHAQSFFCAFSPLKRLSSSSVNSDVSSHGISPNLMCSRNLSRPPCISCPSRPS